MKVSLRVQQADAVISTDDNVTIGTFSVEKLEYEVDIRLFKESLIKMIEEINDEKEE